MHLNTQAIAVEDAGDEGVHVGNVFKLAKEMEGGSSSESEDHPIVQAGCIESERLKPAVVAASSDREDQGFTRAKILILCPFKQSAYQVIEQIVFLLNGGKWKKT